MDFKSEHDRLVERIPEVLADLLGIGLNDIQKNSHNPTGADLVISAAGHTFVVEFKKTNTAAILSATAKDVKEGGKRLGRRVIPLIAVPFMGEVGHRLCKEEDISWIDLSGNAHIIAPGIRIIVAGRPNRFLSAGRPPNIFAPKSSRVVRWLLIHPTELQTQREIARATDMTEGFVSRIVKRLEHEGYLVREKSGAVRPKDPEILLDAWREAYQFSKHELHQGHIAARSGDTLLKYVCNTLAMMGIEHAATGLAAAWVLTHFAAFRIATIYLSGDLSPSVLNQLDYREDPRGANLWLAIPKDEGVFHGAVEKNGIRCVHPVQVYLDLKEHPERSQEAAHRLREEFLTWKRNG
jgi:hypothetical protein